MQIEVATENRFVSGHFGKCEQLTVFKAEDKRIKENVLLDIIAHSHCLLPFFPASNGVETVIAMSIKR